MDKVTIYRVLWSTLKLDATNRHGLADVITLEDHRRALDAEREKVKALEVVVADHHRLVREADVALNGEAGAARQASLCDLVSQLAALQAELEGLEQGCFIHHVDKEQAEMKIALLEGTIGMRATERIDLLSQLENTEAQLRQVEGELANEKAAYKKLSEQWNKDSLDLQAKDAEIAACEEAIANMEKQMTEERVWLEQTNKTNESLTHTNYRLREALQPFAGNQAEYEKRLTTLRQLVEAILLADERGQGLPFKEAMDAAAKAINWNSLPPTPRRNDHE